MIELSGIGLQRGRKALLEDTSLRIHGGEKLALVGANGSGKSSLFALLMGELTPEAGTLDMPAGCRIAYMAQELAGSPRAAVDYVLDGDTELRRLESELATVTDGTRLAELHAAFEAAGGHTAGPRAEKLLAGLGFADGDGQRPVSDFSGGWRLRLSLARTLMQPSDLMLLDEPTNHLDLDAALWLERWLAGYGGTLLLISHDRDFIDGVCDGVMHLENRTLTRYRGNYSAFERQRSERLLQQQALYEQQQRRRAEIQRFVDRFRAKATKAKQAQSRIKALERMEEVLPASVSTPFTFRFARPDKLSDPLLTLSDAELGYGGTPVLREVGLNVHPGSRIGLLGANGAGKSTLLKTLAGELAPLRGSRTEGRNLKLGYFTQHQLDALDLEASATAHLQRLSPRARDQEILDFLGSFNFRDEQATGAIQHFSGGEKARLALAIVVWQRPNLLLLDEPTNHLDLDLCQALTESLELFEGALVLVSHDRHLMRHTTDELWLVANGALTAWEGDLDAYRDWLLGRKRRAGKATPAAARADSHADSHAGAKARRQAAAAQRRREKPLRNELAATEKQLQRCQRALQRLEEQLADAGLYEAARRDELQELLQEQGRQRRHCDELEERWLELQETLESGAA